jgi:hypothetical protein
VGGGASGRRVAARGGAACEGGGVAGSIGVDSCRLVGEEGAASRRLLEGSCRAGWGLEKVARRHSLGNRGMVTGSEGRSLASFVEVRTYKGPEWMRAVVVALGRGLWTRDTCP